MTRPSCTLLNTGLALLLATAASTAAAQQAPVTGRMLSGPLPAAAAAAPASPVAASSPAPRQIAVPGDTSAAEVFPLDAGADSDVAAEPAPAYPPAPQPAYVAAPAPASAAPAYTGASAAAPAPRVRHQPGDATRQLLQLQASGTQAGRALPILGDQATASYRRYLKSFDHELPVFFENNVGKSVQGGGGN